MEDVFSLIPMAVLCNLAAIETRSAQILLTRFCSWVFQFEVSPFLQKPYIRKQSSQFILQFRPLILPDKETIIHPQLESFLHNMPQIISSSTSTTSAYLRFICYSFCESLPIYLNFLFCDFFFRHSLATSDLLESIHVYEITNQVCFYYCTVCMFEVELKGCVLAVKCFTSRYMFLTKLLGLFFQFFFFFNLD